MKDVSPEHWQIFRIQDKISMHPKASHLAEDFACRCIIKKLPREESVFALGELYRQCNEVAENIFSRMEKAMAED